MSGTKPTIGLVHGSWNGSWCWELLEPELNGRGYPTIAVDLPIEDPQADFDKYAEVTTQAVGSAENLVLLGHSRGGNVLQRVANMRAVDQLIYLCSSFEPATLGDPLTEPKSSPPPRNSRVFSQGIIELGNNMTEYNKELAHRVFYQDCSGEIAQSAIKRLRKQRRSPDEPSLEKRPDVPQSYILCVNDQAVNPAWSRYIGKYYLKLEKFVELPGGHTPQLSRPAQLADTLEEIITTVGY